MPSDVAPYGPRELAADLRRLRAIPVLRKTDLQDWYEQARVVQQRIQASTALVDQMTEAIWHFLIDADTRLKDERYREMQERQIEAEMGRLEAAKGG